MLDGYAVNQSKYISKDLVILQIHFHPSSDLITNSDPSNSDQTLLSRINNTYSNGFAKAIYHAKKTNHEDLAELAVKRFFSYNPHDIEMRKLFPQFIDVLDSLSNRLTEETAKINDKKQDPNSWVTIGNCYLQLGDFTNAYGAFIHLLDYDINGQNADSIIYNSIYYFYAIGILYHHYNFFLQAKKSYETMLNHNKFNDFPYKEDLYFRIALLFRQINEFDKSLLYFQKIIDRPPNNLLNPDIQLQIAYTLHLKSEISDSKKIYSELFDQYKDFIPFRQQYSWFKYLTESKQSLKDFLIILEDWTNNPKPDQTLLLISARIAMKIGLHDIAYAKYHACFTNFYDSPAFWCAIGILFYEMHRINDAIVAFKRSLYIYNELEESWLNLGLCFEENNQIIYANRIYRTGIQNCPNSKAIKERLSFLEKGQNNINAKIIDLNDLKSFLQVPEIQAKEYIRSVPKLPALLFGEEDDEKFAQLSTFPQSLFLQK